jgi:DNA recombination protein RmuC
MRAAVDEQVQATMDRGLGETFRDVRAQLESVQQNLKEMQQLASNVSDFRRVLTNVSSRGSWGVVRLSSLLEQSLSAGQYAADVKTKRDSDERVKFAVRLPGREAGDDRPVWLPIDAGFPLGAYQRLISARDGGDATEIDTVGAALENALTVRARAVGDKFLDPPFTTDFAVMFLPVEGLYAEVLRRQGLAESLQRECRVVVCGPTTLAALLNSLQMGFRTLAIEQRSIEVWRLLGAVRTQFDSFGRVLGAVQAKLQEASTSISAVETDARAIQERLQDVPVLPVAEAWSRPASVLPALETDDDEAVPEPAAVVPAEPVAVEHPTDPA